MKTTPLLLTLYILLLSNQLIFAQASDTPDSPKSYASYYEIPQTKVLVVGTFHFDYPGLDEVKTAENDKIDVLTEPKATELTELIQYIKRFKPNKIAIEAFPRWNTQEKFNDYKDGTQQHQQDERYQLGMRIAQDLNIDSLYPIDAVDLKRELWKKDSVLTKGLFNSVNWEVEDPFWEQAKKGFTYEDQLRKEMSLLNYFKRMNSREAHNFNYGSYLTGAFETGDGQGADHLSLWWYNRNVRIFQKIQQITSSPDDRILVIIGNGHASILRQLYEASPEFEFVEFTSLEN